MAHVQFQRHWRIAGDDGKTVADGFTSVAKAEQWAKEHGVPLEPYERLKKAR